MEKEEIYDKILENLGVANAAWGYLLSQEVLGTIPKDTLMRDGLILNYFCGYDILTGKIVSLLGVDFSKYRKKYQIKGYDTWLFIDTNALKEDLIENKKDILKAIETAKRLVNIVTGQTFEDLIEQLVGEVQLLNKNREKLNDIIKQALVA